MKKTILFSEQQPDPLRNTRFDTIDGSKYYICVRKGNIMFPLLIISKQVIVVKL